MGDEAEGVFEAICSNEGRSWARYGLRRPRLAVQMLPAKVRYTPDYLCNKELVEVQGFGKDQTIKTKVEKLDALAWWSNAMPVHIFLWDSTNRRYLERQLAWLRTMIRRHGTEEVFPEGKVYYAFPASKVTPRLWTYIE
jgi:hypothetical protein